jgi:predicted aminopeptidase
MTAWFKCKTLDVLDASIHMTLISPALRRFAWLVLMALWVCSSAACSTVSYYSQSVAGHWSLLSLAKPVDDWLADTQTPEPLKEQLRLSQQLRDFAVSHLHLPDNASYRRYAQLPRSAAVWNVVAAPELSLKLHTWCLAVVGCVGYRGYFDPAQAQALATQLRSQGLEANVYPIPAYSTLGRLPGKFFSDPLLSSFIHYSEADLARLIFHELAHQVAYAPGDSAFNESFATAVERLGVARWLAQRPTSLAGQQFDQHQERRAQFKTLARQTRAQLDAVFQAPLTDEQKRQSKAQIMAQMRTAHQALKEDVWNGFSGYDTWVYQANNAALGALGLYDDLVPKFEHLFQVSQENFEQFYLEVNRLAKLPRAERYQALNLQE